MNILNPQLHEFDTVLISKRPLMFAGQNDCYILRDTGQREPRLAFESWSSVGTEEEREPLVMRDLLTYHEAKISALMGASTRTVTINKGDRTNQGEEGEAGEFEPAGVIVGLVGPRMDKDGVMESQELKVSEDQNTEEKMKGDSVLNLFAEFYNIKKVPTFEKLFAAHTNGLNQGVAWLSTLTKLFNKKSSNSRKLLNDYVEMTGRRNEKQFLHVAGYRQRLRISFETLLAEADHRAATASRKAYVHVVGLGLGVWRIYSGQVDLFTTEMVETAARLRLQNISDVDFSWVVNTGKQSVTFGERILTDGELIPGTNMKMHVSKRNPWDKLEGEDRDKLVVASWAWDGLSFVGRIMTHCSEMNHLWSESQCEIFSR